MANNIFFALAAALLMVGCAKVEPEYQKAEDLDITFQVGKYAAGTKANPEGYAEYTGSSFGAIAVFTPGSFASTKSSAVTYMDRVEITKQSNVWRSVTTYRWPKAGKLSFASYSPYTAGQSCNIRVDENTNDIIFEDYTVGTDDLMYSDPVLDQTANENNYYEHGYNGVPTLFHHALSLVSFSFEYSAPDGAKIVLNSATISNIAKTGSYKGGEAVWTPKSGAQTTEYDIDNEEAYFYVMPQDLDNGQMLNINADMVFTLTAADGRDVEVKAPIVVSVPIETDDVKVWESGKKIEYTVTISGNAALIKFSGKASEWQNENSNVLI